ncbi:MAG: DUF805 domain-containing protein [Hyphomicrobiales bacterium]|nr:DUF805 domain-containing protein [Hyphomicrobiales bacterium]
MPATFLWFLFDWRGRLGRRPYGTSTLALGVAGAALGLVPYRNVAFLVSLAAIQLVIQAALDAKRLHDIGLSAKWVAISSVACVAIAQRLYYMQPALAKLVTSWTEDSIGEAAQNPTLCILAAGLVGAAALRSAALMAPKSSEKGAIYAYDPLVKLKSAGESRHDSLDADALIAKALADQRLKDAAAAMQRVAADSQRTFAPAKIFGRRSA